MGRTTFEQLRADEKTRGQFSRGPFRNLMMVIFGPRYPSWLRRGEKLNEEDVDFLRRDADSRYYS